MAPYFRQTKLLCAANDWVRVDGGPGRAGQRSYIVLLIPACILIRRRRRRRDPLPDAGGQQVMGGVYVHTF